MKEPCKKIKYGTKEIAEEDLKRIRKTSKKEILPVSVYKCAQCNSWHLTSKPYYTEELRNNLPVKSSSCHRVLMTTIAPFCINRV